MDVACATRSSSRSSSARWTWLRPILACLLVLGQLAGCASTKPIPEVSEQQRERLGVVGVVSVVFPPEDQFSTPLRGRAAGAAKGAGAGALAGAGEFLDAFAFAGGGCSGIVDCSAVILLHTAFMAAGVVIGGIAGAVEAVPEEAARQIEAQIVAVLSEARPQEALRQAVIKAAAEGVSGSVVELTTPGPGTAEERFDYGSFRAFGVDTVLEVGITRLGLAGRGGADPQLLLFVQARALLIDVTTSMELYRQPVLLHVSAPRKFTEWGADDARLMKEELQRAHSELAERIVDQVFLEVRSH